MKDVAVVASCRTGIAKATHGVPMAVHVMREAIARAGIEAGEIDDGILGGGLLEGATGHNIARNAALYVGLRVGVPGITVNHHCGSGILAASMLATRIATAVWLQH